MKIANSCPNGCELPLRKKTIIMDTSGSYTFGYHDFRFCPNCGAMMPRTLNKMKAFFDVYDLHPLLAEAKRMLLKSEYESAAREAFVILENVIKEKAELPDLHGKDLVAKALGFEIDKQTGMLVRPPLIALNKLETDSQRNEQEGIKLMLMGFFQGPRNLYHHNSIGTSVNMTISIFLEASFFLYIIENNMSLLEKGHWIRGKLTYQSIYENTPKRIDRLRLHLIQNIRKIRLKQKSRIKYNDPGSSQT